MYRKIFLSFILILSMLGSTAVASQTPLEQKGSLVTPSAEDSISVLSHSIEIQWKGSQPTVHTTTVLKNENAEKDISFRMGMPASPYKSMKVNTPTVYIDGKKQEISQKKAPTPEEKGEDPYITWHTWKMSLKPGQTKAYECSYSLTPETPEPGVKTIKIPLKLLRHWGKPITQVYVTMEASYPYSYHPSPSIVPTEIGRDGKLEWKYVNKDTFDDLIISIKDPEPIAIHFLSESQDENILKMIDAYKNGEISDFNSESEQYLKNTPPPKYSKEVKYLKAQVALMTFQSQEALALLDEIEEDPGFGDQQALIQLKIAYDKYQLLKELDQDADAYAVTLQSQSPVFNAWLQDISPLDKAAPSSHTSIAPAQKENQNPSPEKRLIKWINVFGVHVPVELLFIIIIAIIAFSVYLAAGRRRYYRRRKRWYRSRRWY